MAGRRSELDVMTVRLALDSDQAIADLARFAARKVTIEADLKTSGIAAIPGIPGISGLASYDQAFQALKSALVVAGSRQPQPVRAQALQTARTIAQSISSYTAPIGTDTAKLTNEAVQAQMRGAVARAQRPYLPRGQFVYGDTGKGAGTPTGPQWNYVSTADYNRQKGIVPREQYMARQVADEQRRYTQQERDEHYAAVSRNVDRRRIAAAERKAATEKERNYQRQNRDETIAARVTAQDRKTQERNEQYADISVIRGRRKAAQQAERDYQRQNRDENADARQIAKSRIVQERQENYAEISEIRAAKRQQANARKIEARQEQDENYAAKSRRIEYAKQVRAGISGREAYVALRQDMIDRPGLGGMFARSTEAAQRQFTQTGYAGGGIGGMLFNAKMAMGPGMASVGRLASPIMSGMSSLMSGVASMSATIGSSMLSVGKSVVSHGATIARSLINLPGTAFRSMTMIRHAFWNLTFMGGLAAGAAYATAKALGPAGQVELWQNQFATLLGLQKGLRGPRATAAGQGMAKERIDWITKEALTMKATIPEAIETGRYLTVHNIFSKRMFKLAADLEQSFGVPLEELVRPFMYLKNQRFGQFLRLGAKFGMTPLAMQEEGIDTKPILKPRLRTKEWYSTVYEKMAGRMERMYGGMREVTAGGYVTKLSNLSDAWFKLRADIGASALPAAKGAIDAMTQAMARIAAKFKGASFSGVGGFVTRAIDYAGDMITADKPFGKMGADISALWSGPNGFGSVLGTMFTKHLENLPFYLKSTWDKLDTVLKKGADYLSAVFEKLPDYWDRLSITLKMSFGQMFSTIGAQLTDLGGKYAPFGMAATAIGGAFYKSGVASATEKGFLGDEYSRKAAMQAMLSRDIPVGMRGYRTLEPELPGTATDKERYAFYQSKQTVVRELLKGDWTTAGAAYSRATDIQQTVQNRTRYWTIDPVTGGAVRVPLSPLPKPLNERQERTQAESLRRRYGELSYPDAMTRKAAGQAPFPAMPGWGSIGDATTEGGGGKKFNEANSPLWNWLKLFWSGKAPRAPAAGGNDLGWSRGYDEMTDYTAYAGDRGQSTDMSLSEWQRRVFGRGQPLSASWQSRIPSPASQSPGMSSVARYSRYSPEFYNRSAEIKTAIYWSTMASRDRRRARNIAAGYPADTKPGEYAAITTAQHKEDRRLAKERSIEEGTEALLRPQDRGPNAMKRTMFADAVDQAVRNRSMSIYAGSPAIDPGLGGGKTDSTSETIIGTSKGLQDSANQQVDLLKTVNKVLEVIRDYLQ